MGAHGPDEVVLVEHQVGVLRVQLIEVLWVVGLRVEWFADERPLLRCDQDGERRAVLTGDEESPVTLLSDRDGECETVQQPLPALSDLLGVGASAGGAGSISLWAARSTSSASSCA